jgi:hypothetical protein
MKTKLLLPLLALAALLSLSAADAPTVTVTDTIKIIQTAPATGTVQAFWEKATTVDGQTFTQPLVENVWKLADTGEIEITLADGTKAKTTRAAVFAAVVAIATEEHGKLKAP